MRERVQETAEKSHNKALEVLIGAKVDANAANEGQLTPVNKAAKNGHIAAMGVLIGAKADVNAAYLTTRNLGRPSQDQHCEKAYACHATLMLHLRLNHHDVDHETTLSRLHGCPDACCSATRAHGCTGARVHNYTAE